MGGQASGMGLPISSGANPSVTGAPPAGSWGSPNLAINPYLSPYMGMFQTDGGTAKPLFSMGALGPHQQAFMAGQLGRALGSANSGMIPLPVTSTRGVPPPPVAAGPTTGGPGGAGPPPGTYVDPATGTIQPFGPPPAYPGGGGP